jgi:hypothetical protein
VRAEVKTENCARAIFSLGKTLTSSLTEVPVAASLKSGLYALGGLYLTKATETPRQAATWASPSVLLELLLGEDVHPAGKSDFTMSPVRASAIAVLRVEAPADVGATTAAVDRAADRATTNVAALAAARRRARATATRGVKITSTCTLLDGVSTTLGHLHPVQDFLKISRSLVDILGLSSTFSISA